MRLRWLVLGLLLAVLLVPAGLVSVARMVQPEGGVWVRLVSFTAHVTVLYAAALLLLLLVLAVSHGAVRRVAGMVCVLVVPLLAVHAWWACGPYVGQPAAAAHAGGGVTVMTSNLSFGDADPARVVEIALRNHADVVVLTEITRTELGQMQAAGLDEVFGYAAGRTGPRAQGTMVFSTHELSDVTPLETAFNGYTMTVALPGGPIHLVAVHPHPPTGDASAWRADHAALRRAALSADDPAVVAGDLNATPDHQPLRALADAGFEDAASASDAGWQPTWPAAGELGLFGVAVPSLLPIDHVLVGDGLSAVSTETVTIEGTDHRALLAHLAPR